MNELSFMQGALVDERFASLFEREEFEVDQTAEEYRLRNPTLSTGKKGRGNGSDSEDDLKDVYEPVEDADEYDDDDDEDNEGGSGNESDPEEEEEDLDSEDLDSIRYDPSGRSSKRKKGDPDEEEVGPIERLSRKIEQKTALKMSSMNRGDEKGRGKAAAKGRLSAPKQQLPAGKKSSGARMYELAEGVASSSALFGHSQQTKAARMSEKQRLSLPIQDRIKTTNTSNSRRSTVGQVGSGGESVASLRYMRNKTKGLVREMSYMPEEASSDQKKRRSSYGDAGESRGGRGSSSGRSSTSNQGRGGGIRSNSTRKR